MEQLVKLSRNTFFTLPGNNDRPLFGIIVVNNKTFVIDAGNSPAHSKTLLYHLNKMGFEMPDWIALTHWHWDHIFGLSSFNTNCIAHYKTVDKIRKMSSQCWDDFSLDIRVNSGEEIAFCRDNIKLELPVRNKLKIVVPNISYRKELSIGLAENFECKIIHVGGDHSDDSSVIFIPKDSIMFIGDCLCTSIYTDKPFYKADKLLIMLNKLLQYDVKLYVESHSDKPVFKADIIAFASLAEDVAKSVENNKLERKMFPLKSKNSYIQNILDTWDFFLDYK